MSLTENLWALVGFSPHLVELGVLQIMRSYGATPLLECLDQDKDVVVPNTRYEAAVRAPPRREVFSPRHFVRDSVHLLAT